MSKLTLNQYQEQAVASAVYPSQYRVTYPALALPGEVGEVAGKILDGAEADEVGKEIGGVLWYLAALAQDLGADLAIRFKPGTKFEDLQLGVVLANNLLGDRETANDYCLSLCHHAGNIANAVKKTLRGDFVINQKRDQILGKIQECLIACAFIADQYGLTLEAIAEQNIAVLTSRVERGTLLGDGDNR